MSDNGKMGGKISANNQNKRSKNEIYFGNLCKTMFNNVEFNIPFFNGWDADVILHDIKLAILWNGPWHYKQIKKGHSLTQVQNRDRIKHREIINNGYIPYVIKDNGKYSKKFVNNEFNKLKIYCGIEQMVSSQAS